MTEEQRKEFLARLEKCLTVYSDDTEVAHIEADSVLYDILIALGYKDIAEAWDEVPKWYC